MPLSSSHTVTPAKTDDTEGGEPDWVKRAIRWAEGFMFVVHTHIHTNIIIYRDDFVTHSSRSSGRGIGGCDDGAQNSYYNTH